MKATPEQQLNTAEEVLAIMERQVERLREALSLQMETNRALLEQRNNAMSIVADLIQKGENLSLQMEANKALLEQRNNAMNIVANLIQKGENV